MFFVKTNDMPADVNILCDYYITSNLKPSSSSTSTVNKNKLLNNIKSIDNNSDSNIKSVLLESIDFIKYDKNPMDYLKTKYQLLSTNSTATASSSTIQSTKLLNGNNNNNGVKSSSSTSSLNITAPQSQASNTIVNNKNSLDLSWSKIKKTGVGLLNLGNNCYLNATLQCLAYTPPLSQWLVAKTHSVACRFKAVKGFCSLCEVERIIYDIFNGCNGCAKPNTLCFNIRST